ncbi:MAG: hemopexin repeat-containing protein [Polaribacter sp.]
MAKQVITGTDKPELVVIFKKDAKIRKKSNQEISSKIVSKEKMGSLQKLFKTEKIKLNPIFSKRGKSIEMPAKASKVLKKLKYDPKSFYHISEVNNLEKMRDELLKNDLVEAAYIKPAATDPGRADLTTPDFSANQGYLNPAPRGLDAKFAWNFGGGRGEGIDIIDVEQGWNLDHEDLQTNVGGLLGGNLVASSENHGTAVLGVMGADDNGKGMTGMSHNAFMRPISHNGLGTAQAIINAADALNAGDLILLEVHRAGPAANKDIRQDGFIAIEWWPDDFAAIVYATSKGIVVVEAAGNGSEDFDTDIYNHKLDGFPSGWKNPFNMNNPQSGAVIVGGGNASSTNDLTILGYSNWGTRVDVQGWGNNVATCGYGGLQGDMFISVDPFNSWNVDPGFPKDLGADIGFLNRFNAGINAALWSDTNNKVYFFKDDKYIRMDAVTHTLDADYPKDIDGNWLGFPESFKKNLDTALWAEKNQKIYFFKGSEYIRVDPNNSWNVDPDYPKPISGNWPGLPANFTSDLDCAVWNDKNEKVYFFKGNQYVRINPNNNWNMDPGYPKPISGNWPGFTNAYKNGVSSGYYSKNDNKLYFSKVEDNFWYTGGFSGTSSASPTVTGALACIQGRLKARGMTLLDSVGAQNLMRSTGTPQKRFSGSNEQSGSSNWKGVPATFGRGIDAALWNGKSDKIYMFRGSQYLRIDPTANWSVEPQYPKPIKDNWPGFPEEFEEDLDAAVWSGTNNKVYFFKGSEYIRVSPNNGWAVDANYPKPIAGNWPGFPANFANGVDAALWNGKSNRIYFFKDDEYIRVNPNDSFNVEPGYPKPIAGNWPNLHASFTNDIGAAVWSGTNKKVYFYKDEDYVRINPFDGWKQGNSYPKLIAKNRIGKRPNLKQAFASLDIDSNWPGFPRSFGQNLDAAVWANKNGKVYFFQGNKYLRVNPNNNWEVDNGYPKPIAGNWNGFPASFANGVDAAVGNDKNNKIYFFKGNEYIRVNPNNNWNVDAGYPKPIAGNWPGFPANFANGIDAAIWSGTNEKIYFFKGNEYLRVDPNNGWNVDAGYPKPIAGNWPTLSAPFTGGLDCALWNGKSNKLYFFTGDEYVKINPANQWKVEKYYPRPIIS